MIGLGGLMFIPYGLNLVTKHPATSPFIESALIVILTGATVFLATRSEDHPPFKIQHYFIFPFFTVILLSLMGALPFYLSDLHLSLTEAIFESTSGFTATNTSILTQQLDRLSPGLLLWRSLTQWVGGALVLALGIIILPELSIGGLQFFKTDYHRRIDHALPIPSHLLLQILTLYGFMTAIFAFALWLGGMSIFDSINHAMTTLSCGGFSTHSTSIGYFHSPTIDWLILFGMILGGLPFFIHWQIWKGHARDILKNKQIQWFFLIQFLSGLGLALWLTYHEKMKPLPALRHGLFAVTSVLTGTGFATYDWSLWRGPPSALFLLLMILGGCAGSTSGGIRIFRLQILLNNAIAELKKLLHHGRIVLSRCEGQKISEEVAESVLAYLFVFVLTFGIISLLLSLTGLDFSLSLTASASALANLGPGLTPETSVTQGLAHLSKAAQWILIVAMIIGRLEIFIPLVLLSKKFWR
jgi:trk system potassium uptake protein TrkH